MKKPKIKISEHLKFGFDLRFELCHLKFTGFSYEIYC